MSQRLDHSLPAEKSAPEPPMSYEKPEVEDFGDLMELTGITPIIPCRGICFS
jgi:hypothetical protein